MLNSEIADATLPRAEDALLAPTGLDLSAARKALAQIAVRGIDDADLYFQSVARESWGLEEGMVKTGTFSLERGFGIRAMSGERTALAYSDEITLPALEDAVRTCRAIGRQGEGSRAAVRGVGTAGVIDATCRYYPAIDPMGLADSAGKVYLLRRLEDLCRSQDTRVIQVMADLHCEYEVMLVMGLSGRVATDIRPLVRLSASVIVQEHGRRESGFAGGGCRGSLRYFEEGVLQEFARSAVDAALVNLQARPAPAGEMTVVLGSGWPGVLLHEAVGHGLEGDFNRKGTGAFSGRVGEQVAAKGVTVVDDGTLAGRRGSLQVDDEGHPTQRNVLIEDGILKGYLLDRYNARLMGMASTGNGRRESYAAMPLPRMTNTFMLTGETDPREILESVRRGIYACNFSGGQVDITSGKFVFSTSEAYWVENGRVQYPIRGATLIGSGPEVLQRVSLIGNDLALDSGIGTCGKEGQSLPVGVGMPTIRIDALTVGGTV